MHNVRPDQAPQQPKVDSTCNIQVIELRNYRVKEGGRETFIQYFEENFIASQEALGAFMLGLYRVKEADDNFCWLRGFRDMPSRTKFLNDFYFGDFWKAHKTVPNSLLLNNDDVYLLKPLSLTEQSNEANIGFDPGWFHHGKGIAVIDFYISNTKLDKLVSFVRQQYVSILTKAHVVDYSFWVSEMRENEFPQLPVFQDKNLLVQITFYHNAEAYKQAMQHIASALTEQQQLDMEDLVTRTRVLVLYPTEKTSAMAIH